MRPGLDVLALTDHDTQAGLAEARAALPEGLTLIPGMELSCQLDGRSVHLLGYLFDPDDPAIAAETARSAMTAPTARRPWWPGSRSSAPGSPGSR